MANPIRKFTNALIAWCADNSAAAKFERTIAQGALGVLAAWLTSLTGMPEWFNVLVAPMIMVVLTPLMATIGTNLGSGEGGAHA